MKQILQSFKTGKLEVAEVPRPVCESGGCVVQVQRSIVSLGTEKSLVDFGKKSLIAKARGRPDLVKKVVEKARKDGVLATFKATQAKLDTPIPLGYSAAGVIKEVGSGVYDLQVGQRVAIGGAGYANHAEFDFVPRNLINPIPDGVSFESAAFTTIGSIALQGIRKASPTLGETVAVLGLGLIGQLTVMMLKANGCKVVGYDPDAEKARWALGVGIDAVCHDDIDETVAAMTSGYGVDSVLITASAPHNGPILTAAEIVKEKGKIVMVGMVPIEIPRDVFYKKELDFSMATSYGPGRYDPSYEEAGLDYPFSFVRWTEGRNMQAVLELMADGRLPVETLITHRFPFSEVEKAYGLMEQSHGPTMGIVLQYQEATDAALKQPSPISLGDSKTLGSGRVQVGFLGCGAFAGSVLIPEFSQNKTIYNKAVTSRSGFTAYNSGRRHGIETIVPSWQELLDLQDLDAVVISTRHKDHAEQTCAALGAGLSVFVEKPLALNQEELTQVAAGLRGAQGILQVGYNRRFSPLWQRVLPFLPEDQPKFVRYSVNAGPLPPEHWIYAADQGGRIKGEVCHFIDTVVALCRSQVLSVYASAHPGGRRNDDNLTVILNMQNGDVAEITYQAVGGAGYPKESVEIHGGGRSFVLDNYRSVSVYRRGRKTHKAVGQEKGFKQEVAAFADAVQRGRPAISYDQLFNVTATTFAIERSLEQGGVQQVGDYWSAAAP